MKTRRILSGVFGVFVVAVAGWQCALAVASGSKAALVSSAARAASPKPTNLTASNGTSATVASSTTPAPVISTGVAATVAPSTVTGTFVGASTPTPYGPVQVNVVISASKITDVIAVHLTATGPRSVAISARAAPILRTEVLASQSAAVATVSGATFVSTAYLTSLQSALDQAHLAH